MINIPRKPTTPWEYLENWAKSDRGPDENLEGLNKRMQNRWPGKYKIIAQLNPEHGGHLVYVFKFNSPADKTMFYLKWS
jgi:hypothetical protein